MRVVFQKMTQLIGHRIVDVIKNMTARFTVTAGIAAYSNLKGLVNQLKALPNTIEERGFNNSKNDWENASCSNTNAWEPSGPMFVKPRSSASHEAP